MHILGSNEVMNLLEVRGLSVRYGEVVAVSGISFDVSEGEVIAILGRNGAGKSSLLKGVSGALPASGGSVTLDGVELLGTGARRIARAGISLVPEGRRLFPGLSVRDNLMLGASNGRVASKQNRMDLYLSILALFPELEDRQDSLAWMLSGGQQQMVAIGRGLMAQPRVLLLDEPTLGLAPIVAKRLLLALKEVRELGCTIVLVEQNVQMALEFAKRGYVLELGKVVTQGEAATLKESQELKLAYLGRRKDSHER